ERTAEPVRDRINAHPSSNGVEAHVAEHLSAWRRKNIRAACYARQALQELDGGLRQRDAMFLAGFHSLGRYGPQLRLQVDFIPGRAAHLKAPGRREDGELERAGADAFALAQLD